MSRRRTRPPWPSPQVQVARPCAGMRVVHLLLPRFGPGGDQGLLRQDEARHPADVLGVRRPRGGRGGQPGGRRQRLRAAAGPFGHLPRRAGQQPRQTGRVHRPPLHLGFNHRQHTVVLRAVDLVPAGPRQDDVSAEVLRHRTGHPAGEVGPGSGVLPDVGGEGERPLLGVRPDGHPLVAAPDETAGALDRAGEGGPPRIAVRAHLRHPAGGAQRGFQLPALHPATAERVRAEEIRVPPEVRRGDRGERDHHHRGDRRPTYRPLLPRLGFHDRAYRFLASGRTEVGGRCPHALTNYGDRKDPYATWRRPPNRRQGRTPRTDPARNRPRSSTTCGPPPPTGGGSGGG